MRIIEKCWVDLYAGYKDIEFLEARLQAEWKRAIQVAHRRSDRVAETRRMQIQKIMRLGFLVFVLLCLLLCAGIYYVQESRTRLLVYLCVLGIMGSLAGAAYMFYRGSLRARVPSPPSLTLMDGWWKALRPRRYLVHTKGDRAEVEFLKSLSFLDDSTIAIWRLLTSARITSDTDVLLLAPGGIWVFEVKNWSGTIFKRDGEWFTQHRNGTTKKQEKSPDDQWLDQRNEIVKTIRMRLPGKTWLADLITGGVVFTHEQARLGPITGNTVPCGKPDAWRARLRDAKPAREFSVEDQFQLLDALIQYANRHEKEALEIRSARDQARQLYESAATDLRKYVAERVK